MAKSLSYGLVLGGGIITFLVAVAAGLFSTSAVLASLSAVHPLLAQAVAALLGVYAIWGIVVGVLTIWSADKIGKGGPDARTGVAIAAIFGILGLITLQGLIIGPVLSLVGAAVAYGETRKSRK
jgi:hypothetical protein